MASTAIEQRERRRPRQQNAATVTIRLHLVLSNNTHDGHDRPQKGDDVVPKTEDAGKGDNWLTAGCIVVRAKGAVVWVGDVEVHRD